MMKKIETMVNDYNAYASKHGYETISVDFAKKKINGGFTPQDEYKHNGFCGYFKNLAIAGRNASLKADFHKIQEAVYKL